MKPAYTIITILCVTAVLFTLGGCGSGGGGSQGSAVTAPSTPTSADNSYSLSEDTYGLQNATFMSATNNSDTFVMRAAIAQSMTDPDFRTIFRIDIVKPELINGPGRYAVTGTDAPVNILFSNGHTSSWLKTVSGSITFTSYGVNSGEKLVGNFVAVVEDQNPENVQWPTYSVRGNFSFSVNSSGILDSAPLPVPLAASSYYDAKCSSCHSLGNHDPICAGGAPDLALTGGEIPELFTADAPGHKGITLTAQEIHDLKILLNAN